MEKYNPEDMNRLDINSPEFHNGGDVEYKTMGFRCKEDYECFMRRKGDRKKAVDTSTVGKEY